MRQRLRTLFRQRGANAITVVLLALGLGTAGTMYSVLDTLVWERNGITEPKNLAVLWRFDPRTEVPFVEVSFLDYVDWRRESKSFADLACFGAANHHAVLHLDVSIGLDISDVSVSFFDVLGAKPAFGRTFSPSEEGPGAERVVVLSHGLWQRLFAGHPGILGQMLRIEKQATHGYRVIGVMPESFAFPVGVEMWMPLRREEPFTNDRLLAYLFLVGRFAPGIDLVRAKAEMDTLIAATDATHHRDRARDNVASVRPFTDYVLGEGVRPALVALSVAVALVVLIAWLNVFNLILVRLTEEEPERAIRRAVGATSMDVTLVVFVDITLLAGLASLGAVVVQAGLLESLRRFGGSELPRLLNARLDPWPVLALATLSALLLGTLAALHIARGASMTQSRHPGQLLLTCEVAIAIVVLAASGLTLRSFTRLSTSDPGYRLDGLLMFDLVARDENYPELDDKRAFHEKAIEVVRAVAGVRSVAGILQRPFRNGSVGWDAHYVYEGQAFDWQELEREGETYHFPRYDDFNMNPTTNWEVVTPGYYETMDIDILEGRDFRHADDDEAPHVVIVSESLAELIWPNQSAIGKGLIVPGSDFTDELYSDFSRVIGVVEDVKYREIDTIRYDVYTTLAQADLPLQGLVVRTEVEPLAVLPTIRAELRELDGSIPLTRIARMQDVVAAQAGWWRFNAVLFTVFAAIASFMTAIGIAGIVARSVTDRRREIGIRLAIGAYPREIVALFVRRAMGPTLAGLALGLSAAVILSRFIETLLFDIDGTDPITYLGVVTLFTAVAVAASYIPAQRATLVDPNVTLRHE